jgi:hypothetical protein
MIRNAQSLVAMTACQIFSVNQLTILPIKQCTCSVDLAAVSNRFFATCPLQRGIWIDVRLTFLELKSINVRSSEAQYPETSDIEHLLKRVPDGFKSLWYTGLVFNCDSLRKRGPIERQRQGPHD